MRNKEKLIFARGKWEIARIEVNSVTGERQWVRRDFSFICTAGDETAEMEMPDKPKQEA